MSNGSRTALNLNETPLTPLTWGEMPPPTARA